MSACRERRPEHFKQRANVLSNPVSPPAIFRYLKAPEFDPNASAVSKAHEQGFGCAMLVYILKTAGSGSDTPRDEFGTSFSRSSVHSMDPTSGLDPKNSYMSNSASSSSRVVTDCGNHRTQDAVAL